jgi:hypothetical protein
MSMVARTRTNPELHIPQQQKDGARSKTPTYDRAEQQTKDSFKSLKQAKTAIKAKQELEEEKAGTSKRPLRSNFEAPPIKPLPRIPIERKQQDRKIIDEVKEQLDAIEKRLNKK